MKFDCPDIGVLYDFRHCAYTERSITSSVGEGSAVDPGSYLQVSNGPGFLLCLSNCISSMVSTGSAVRVGVQFTLKRT